MKKYILIIHLFLVGILNAQEINYTIKNIESNSKYQDFGTAFYKDSLVVFASTRNRKSISKKIWFGNSQPYLELYTGIVDSDGEINEVKLISKGINSKYHDANVIFTKDHKTVYFTSDNYLKKKFVKDTLGWNLNQLYRAKVSDKGTFVDIEPMPFNSDNYQTGHPALSKDETKLYFISDMPGSIGLTDIFMVDVHHDGTYGSPINLGPNINTEGKEMFPFLDVNNVLYYSSDGYTGGFGGLDIYANQMMSNEALNKSISIGSPLNSELDDFAIVFQNEKRTGYFSSNRKGGRGDDDIYFFKELTPIVFECNQFVSGVVKDTKTNEIISNATIEVFGDDNIVLASVKSDELGQFSLELACDSTYRFVGSKKGYSPGDNEIVTNNKNELKHNIVLNLNPDFIEVSGELAVNIPPIYFDFDKSNITKDAAVELQKIVDIMSKYPEIIVEYQSHTDSRGADSYNMKLSDRRAKSSEKWIVGKGIMNSRISGKGYGELELVNKCSNGILCSEEEHQLNRRSDFIVMNPEVIK